MPAPAPADVPPVSPSRARRLGRAFLSFVLLLWIGFVAVSSYHWINYTPPDEHPLTVRLCLSLFFLAGPGWILVRRLRGLSRPSRPSLAASAMLTASVAVFLAWFAHDDETWRHSERAPALRSDFPEAAATHALTLRYSTSAPGSLLSSLPDTKLVLPSTEPGEKNDVMWAAFLEKNGPALDAFWIQLAPLRAWIDQLAAAPALGDLTEDFDSPILGFKALRMAGQFTCAHALQLAADGRRDEAVETLLPVYVAAQKLEPHARTLVRRMISVVLQRQVQNTLARVLDAGAISATTRARLAAALAPRSDAAEQARLLIWCEYTLLCKLLFAIDAPNATTIFSLPGSENLLLRAGARIAFTSLLNPNLTANRYGEHLSRQADFAARRDFSGLKAEHEAFARYLKTSIPGKNQGGRTFLAMAAPAYTKVMESYWKADDERAALLARLNR